MVTYFEQRTLYISSYCIYYCIETLHHRSGKIKKKSTQDNVRYSFINKLKIKQFTSGILISMHLQSAPYIEYLKNNFILRNICYLAMLLREHWSQSIDVQIVNYNQIYMYDTDLFTLCHMDVRGDEYHYILHVLCPFFKRSRKQFLKP